MILLDPGHMTEDEAEAELDGDSEQELALEQL